LQRKENQLEATGEKPVATSLTTKKSKLPMEKKLIVTSFVIREKLIATPLGTNIFFFHIIDYRI
jgi:hypothetical protein